jgi:Zn-dependent M16 (insulinase) family peptidase
MLTRATTKLLKGKLACGVNRRFSEVQSGVRAPLNIKVGEVQNNFELLSKERFDDFDLTLYKFQHKNLGTVHYHIERKDSNNSFAVSFRTVPEDSTGKMHILEHLALCGSEKYPVRDPFMNMLRRSLNTYMNAWTGPDFTAYPFSTANTADFYNLLSVYAEAVFKPLLRRTDFLQEGWRLEHQNPLDPNTPLQIKGVVYNEMKGVYENPDNLFMESLQSMLMPGTPYIHDAGGKPSDIPNLTHEDLKNYHKKNYHPSNATIFTYGDMDVRKHQSFLEENFLSSFKNLSFKKPSMEPTLNSPIRKKITMPPPAVELQKGKDSMFGTSFLCNQMGKDIEDSIGLSLLSYLLFDTPSSPFYVDFLETGLADAYSPGHGYESNVLPSFFTIGFKNIKRGSEEEVEKKIMDTLKRVAEEGFEPELVEAACHQLEIQSKVEQSNFGLQLFQGFLGPITHNQDNLIKQGLSLKQTLEHIRKEAPNGYFENLIKKYFLNNNKRLSLTIETDEKYNEKLQEEEKSLLQKLEKGLDAEGRKRVLREADELKKAQETEQDLNVLPTLTTQDIPLASPPTLVSIENLDKTKLFFFEKPTNGLTYLRIKIDLTSLDHSNIHHLHILSLLFNQLGTQQHRYDEFSELLQLHTTGFSFNIFYDGHPHDANKVDGFAILSITCLDRNINKMFELLNEILTAPDFKDFEHITKLIRMSSSAAASRLVEKPLEFAIDYGVSSHRPAQQYYNKLANNRFLTNYGTNLQKNESRLFLEDLEFSLSYILQKIIKRSHLSFSIHSAQSNRPEIRTNIQNLLSSLKNTYKSRPWCNTRI